jgi:hypothetical protein
VINSREIVREILSGMTDVKLMEKYRLTTKGLEYVFRQLLDMRALNHIDIMAWSIFGNKIISTKNIRLFPRQSLDFLLPVFDPAHPELEGAVQNVSLNGLCVRGIPATVGEIKTFSISLDLSHQVVSHPFRARCRWSRVHRESEDHVIGFSVSSDSRDTWKKILNGIKMVRWLAGGGGRA